MKFKFSKTLVLVAIGLTLLFLAGPAVLAGGSDATSTNISFDTSVTPSSGFSWNPGTFEGFRFSVNDYCSYVDKDAGEKLYYEDRGGNGPLGSDFPENNIIDEGELIYSTRPSASTYKLASSLKLDNYTIPPEIGNTSYSEISLLGSPYVAVDNDATQLAKLVYNQGDEEKILKVGESWDLGAGYELSMQQVDLNGNKVLLSLEKNGTEIDSGIVDVNGTLEGQTFVSRADTDNSTDSLYFITYADKVFQSRDTFYAVFKYTWLIDKDDVQLVKAGDVYQGFKVRTAGPDGLLLSNKDPITINVDEGQKTYFTDAWYFQTSDENKGKGNKGYIIFPAVDKTKIKTNAIRGVPADTSQTSDFSWNAATFRGFNYSANSHLLYVDSGLGEKLYYEDKGGNGPLGSGSPDNNIIDKDELIYSTRPYRSSYEFASGVGLNKSIGPSDIGNTYSELSWFGVPYVAIDNDSTQLARIVYEQEGDDKMILKTGDNWDLGSGYNLVVQQIDEGGKKVCFSLLKDGNEIDSGVVDAGSMDGGTFCTARANFGNSKDQLYFITCVSNVFHSSSDSFAVFKYTWLIDKDNVQIINAGDNYQGFEVKTAGPDGLLLSNTHQIALKSDEDKKTYFTNSWYFQASDENKGKDNKGYIVCPVCDLSKAAADNSSFSSSQNSGETVSNEEDFQVTEPAENTSASKPQDNPKKQNSSVFGVIFAVLGIAAVYFLSKKK